MDDPLTVIYNEGYWQVNRVSPMYNLQYNEIKFKQYATKIRQDLASGNVASVLQITVSFESLHSLKYSREDPAALQITVNTCSKDRFKSNNKEVYLAILLSWGDFLDGNNYTTHLPYMLERGERRVGDILKNTMHTLFDCMILPFRFSKRQLMELMFQFVENDTSRSTDPFVLIFKTPQINFKDKNKLTFEIGDIRTLWKNIKEGGYNEAYAYQYLQHQIYCMYKLDMKVLDLCEVQLPKAEVKSSGVVKLKTPEMINATFTILNRISQIFWHVENRWRHENSPL